MLNFNLKTYGCKVNTYDGSLLEKNLMAAGFKKGDLPKVFILNTCAVTAEATLEARREARRIKRRHPDALVVATGCAAQVDTEKFCLDTEVDMVVANSHKGEIAEIIRKRLSGDLSQNIFKSNVFKKEDFEPGGGIASTKSRAFLKIQDGCNSFCTYCVIPFARGKSRSLPIKDLRDRVQDLHRKGFNEIVLTGVHIGDYEFGLVPLVQDLLRNTDVPRFRLSSLEPQELTDDLLDAFQDPRLCPHFHMSIQSASDNILRGMKRNYQAAQVKESLLKIAEKLPTAYVGMDVIVGFPGEGEGEFLETYQNLDSLPWTRIHVFPYSPRPQTYALKLPDQVSKPVIQARAGRLRELSSSRLEKMALQQLGQLKQVMYLKTKAPQALSRDYWPVELVGGHVNGPGESSPLRVGEEAWVRVTEYQPPGASRMDGFLRAEWV